MGNGNPLMGVGQPCTFTEAELNGYDRRWIEPLKAIGVFESFIGDSWFCDVCDDEHDYDIMGNRRLKACQNDTSAPFVPVSDSEATRWLLNWANLLRKIQTKNHLSLFSFTSTMPGLFPVGKAAGGSLLVILTCFGESAKFINRLQAVSGIYPDTEKLFICVDSPLPDAIHKAFFEKSQCRLVSLESLIQNDWQLNISEEVEQFRLCINRSLQELIIDGVSIPLSSAEFQTALILARANGSPVSETQFSDEYYGLESDSARLCSLSPEMPTLKDTVYHINTKIQKHNRNIQGQVFKSMRGKRGYRVIPDFCPVKIL